MTVPLVLLLLPLPADSTGCLMLQVCQVLQHHSLR
jgi:hypothetical protein